MAIHSLPLHIRDRRYSERDDQLQNSSKIYCRPNTFLLRHLQKKIFLFYNWSFRSEQRRSLSHMDKTKPRFLLLLFALISISRLWQNLKRKRFKIEWKKGSRFLPYQIFFGGRSMALPKLVTVTKFDTSPIRHFPNWGTVHFLKVSDWGNF